MLVVNLETSPKNEPSSKGVPFYHDLSHMDLLINNVDIEWIV
jgi:hypothetical protein